MVEFGVMYLCEEYKIDKNGDCKHYIPNKEDKK